MAVAGGDSGGHRRRGRQGAGPGRSGRVAVLALVGHHQHGRVVGGALHVLPRRASPHSAALVVAPVDHMTRKQSDSLRDDGGDETSDSGSRWRKFTVGKGSP